MTAAIVPRMTPPPPRRRAAKPLRPTPQPKTTPKVTPPVPLPAITVEPLPTGPAIEPPPLIVPPEPARSEVAQAPAPPEPRLPEPMPVLSVPPILLEGDSSASLPAALAAQGPSPAPPAPPPASEPAPMAAAGLTDSLHPGSAPSLPAPLSETDSPAALRPSAPAGAEAVLIGTPTAPPLAGVAGAGAPPEPPTALQEELPEAPAPPPALGPALPTTHGTGRLFLFARDPHWLYACWDHADQAWRDLNRQAPAGRLALRVYLGEIGPLPLLEVELSPEAHSWFIHVGRGGATFRAELGFQDRGGHWRSLAVSEPVATPADLPAGTQPGLWATIPIDVPLTEIRQRLEPAAPASAPLIDALRQAQQQAGRPDGSASLATSPWTAAHEQALAELLASEEMWRTVANSAEIVAWLRQRLFKELAPSAPQGPPAASPGMASGELAFSEPAAGHGPPARAFWLNLQAELIVYGATEPTAKLKVAGQPVALRPDGTFSLRFALPDGHYELPVRAVSAREDDARSATLQFSRQTEYWGDVGATASPPDLSPPPATPPVK